MLLQVLRLVLLLLLLLLLLCLRLLLLLLQLLRLPFWFRLCVCLCSCFCFCCIFCFLLPAPTYLCPSAGPERARYRCPLARRLPVSSFSGKTCSSVFWRSAFWHALRHLPVGQNGRSPMDIPIRVPICVPNIIRSGYTKSVLATVCGMCFVCVSCAVWCVKYVMCHVCVEGARVMCVVYCVVCVKGAAPLSSYELFNRNKWSIRYWSWNLPRLLARGLPFKGYSWRNQKKLLPITTHGCHVLTFLVTTSLYQDEPLPWWVIGPELSVNVGGWVHGRS